MEKLRLAPSTVPYYTMTLPVSKIVVKYRPFLVKEEKVLLIALQSGNPNQVIDAIRNMILACTDNKLDTKKISAADANHAMLQIRAKSVGEELKPSVKCPKCEGKTPVKINIDKLQTQTIIDDKNPNIKINDDITLVMRYPTIHVLDATKDETSMIFEMTYSCIDKVLYKEEVYERGNVNEDDINLFVENMLPEQFKEITEYLKSAPSVKYEFGFTCPACQNKMNVAMENITDFFL
jgi:type III secretory pathway component EscV